MKRIILIFQVILIFSFSFTEIFSKKQFEILWTNNLPNGNIAFTPSDNFLFIFLSNSIKVVNLKDGTIINEIFGDYLAGTISKANNELIVIGNKTDSLIIDFYDCINFQKKDSIKYFTMNINFAFNIVSSFDGETFAFSTGFDYQVYNRKLKKNIYTAELKYFDLIQPISFTQDNKSILFRYKNELSKPKINKIQLFHLENKQFIDYIPEANNFLLKRNADKYINTFYDSLKWKNEYGIYFLSNNSILDTIEKADNFTPYFYGNNFIVLKHNIFQSKLIYFVDEEDQNKNEIVELTDSLNYYSFNFSNNENYIIARNKIGTEWNYKFLKIKDDVSVSEIRKQEIYLFPNPVTSSFSLSQIPDGAISYVIYNNLGVKQSEGLLGKEIDVSFLPSGIYFLKLNNQVKPIKFVKL